MKIPFLLAAALSPMAASAALVPAAVPAARAPQAVSLPAMMPVRPIAGLPAQRLPALDNALRLPNVIHPLAAGGARLGAFIAGVPSPAAPARPSQDSRNERLRKLYDGSERRPVSRPPAKPRERGYYPIPESDLLDDIGIK